MYVKVHKKDNRWFKYDTGELVGKEVPEGQKLENLKILYGDNIIISNNNKYLIVYHGYFNTEGNFFRFCKRKVCQHCSNSIRTLACPNYVSKPTAGYYIKTSD